MVCVCSEFEPKLSQVGAPITTFSSAAMKYAYILGIETTPPVPPRAHLSLTYQLKNVYHSYPHTQVWTIALSKGHYELAMLI